MAASTGNSSNPKGTDISIHFNDLLNNVVYVYNGATDILDAKLNYWGSSFGSAPGMISGHIDYTPWLRAPVMDQGSIGVRLFLVPPGPASPFK